MEIIQTETNRGNKAILAEGTLYRKKNVPNLLQLTKMDYLLQRNATATFIM